MLHRVSMETPSHSCNWSPWSGFLQLPMFPWKQALHSHNSLHESRYLQLSRVSMETAIHSPNTFPRNPPLEATLCFHGNNHPQSQHVSVETVTRSYPVSMETTIRSHNTFPWKPPLASAPFCMETPFDRHNPFPWNSCYCTIVALRNDQSIP